MNPFITKLCDRTGRTALRDVGKNVQLLRNLLKHGRFIAFYSDKYTVFRVPKSNEHMTGMSPFGRALAELNIEIICANSSQAKGRISAGPIPVRSGQLKKGQALRLLLVSERDGHAYQPTITPFVVRQMAKGGDVVGCAIGRHNSNTRRHVKLGPVDIRVPVDRRD